MTLEKVDQVKTFGKKNKETDFIHTPCLLFQETSKVEMEILRLKIWHQKKKALTKIIYFIFTFQCNISQKIFITKVRCSSI